CQQPNSYPITF
nr:immunoglobulin light chain junction region [Macaca mulatta]